jgi:hypothetical protein
MNCRNLKLSLNEGLAILRNADKITRRQHLTCQNNLIFSNTSVKTSNFALLKISEERHVNKLVKGIDSLQYHLCNVKDV